MKLPGECQSLDELRHEIDNVDTQIIELISKRFGFVKEVVKYKKHDRDSIIAKDRYNAVIKKRREWASQKGLDPTVIEKMYREMMDYFIREELKIANNQE